MWLVVQSLVRGKGMENGDWSDMEERRRGEYLERLMCFSLRVLMCFLYCCVFFLF